MAVVARAGQHLFVPHLVDTAVADVRPESAPFLHEAHGAGCPRPEIDVEIRAECDDRIVSPRQGHVEEALRVEYRLLRRREHVLHDLEPGFGRLGAVGVPAHAVEHEHERRVLGHDDGGTILVILTISERGDLGVFDLHRKLRWLSAATAA